MAACSARVAGLEMALAVLPWWNGIQAVSIPWARALHTPRGDSWPPWAPPLPRASREAGGMQLCLVSATALLYLLQLCFHLKQAGEPHGATHPSVPPPPAAIAIANQLGYFSTPTAGWSLSSRQKVAVLHRALGTQHCSEMRMGKIKPMTFLQEELGKSLLNL